MAEKPGIPNRFFERAALWIAVMAAAALLAAGPGSRLGWWPFGTGFSIMRYGFYGGVISLLLLIIGLYRNRKRYTPSDWMKLLPLLGATFLLFLLPLNLVRAASHLPRIHDITTDTEDPPQFVAIVPLRKEARNSIVYEGDRIARMQNAAYPDIRPLLLAITPDQAFDRALETAESLKWDVIEANRPEGRIEATDTTFWFGFKDDIVIRIRPSGGGSRIDLRSVSRVGVSDVGANAARIQKFTRRCNPEKSPVSGPN